MNPIKKCTCCLKAKCLTDYYTKGNRIDSRCKACVKDGKKDTRKKVKKRSRENSKRRISRKTIDVVLFEVRQVGQPSQELQREIFSDFIKEVA